MQASEQRLATGPEIPMRPGSGFAAQLEVYGLRLVIDGDWRTLIDDLSREFGWFATSRADVPPQVSVTIARRPPSPERFSSVPQAFITTRNVVFQAGATTIIDYSGRVLVVYDRARDQVTIEGEDEHLVHEATYMFLLSRIGRHLDESGLMRIHALGLAGAQGAVLVLLPSGGGKTTLALRALGAPGVRLLSEDTPVLDRHGLVHPFPLRMGVNVTDGDRLPGASVRRIERLEYAPKLLVDVETFADRISEGPCPLRHLVVAERSLGGGGTLRPVPRSELVGPLLRDGVVGVGVAQMIEYVLRQGARDLLRQGGVAAGRARCCARALVRARTWRLEVGRDVEATWAALNSLLQ